MGGVERMRRSSDGIEAESAEQRQKVEELRFNGNSEPRNATVTCSFQPRVLRLPYFTFPTAGNHSAIQSNTRCT